MLNPRRNWKCCWRNRRVSVRRGGAAACCFHSRESGCASRRASAYLRPDGTSTSSGSIGTRRGVCIWRTRNPNGFGGTESAFTSGRKLWRWIPFAALCGGSPGYVDELRNNGISFKYLDFGGGLGVRYTTENPPGRAEYARMVAQILRPLGLHLLLEPGRTIIGPAGVLLTRVVYVKESRGKTFVVVDAAMNDLMRPALYGAVHPITQVTRRKSDAYPRQRVDVVGPVCETGDCFLHDWPLGRVETATSWRSGSLGLMG